MKAVGIGLIHVYRVVFAWLPSSCRYEPTCSRYAVEAIGRHGVVGGLGDCPRRVAFGWAAHLVRGGRAAPVRLRGGGLHVLEELRSGSYRPLPVRERLISKRDGCRRR